MKILAIETSCDETGASVVEKDGNKIKVLSNVVATSLSLHAKTGGIIPENAARMQTEYIIPVITKALIQAASSDNNSLPNNNIKSVTKEELEQANIILKEDIDAIAVTHGPGLIGSLLIGAETAKTLSFTFNKPIVPVNHLLAHIFANFISSSKRYTLNANIFPFIGLIVSGGHTDLLLFENHGSFKWLGGTRDDAAGEALDKIGRVLNLSYPAGPEIEVRASKISKPSFSFTSPLINSDDFDFSFSGLKAETSRFVQKNKINEKMKNEICFATQKAIIDVLIKKTIRAAKLYNVKTILLGGGVSANQSLLEQMGLNAKRYLLNAKVFSPEKIYCTDNAAMIGAYALLDYKPVPWQKIETNPGLYFD